MPYSPTDWVDGVTPVDASRLDKMEAGLVAAEEKALKAQANGYASLDATGKVPIAQLPPVGSDLTYLGDYSPTVTYNDGDFVIGADGLTYVCVQNGTVGVAPAPWNSGQWGIPQPVVNGQWIKGSGGAAIWSAITPADVPGIAWHETVGQNISAANTDLAWPSGSAPMSTMVTSAGGGSLRSVAVPGAGNGARLVIINNATPFTILHNVTGGSGKVLVTKTSLNVVLLAYDSMEFEYNGSNWLEVDRNLHVGVEQVASYFDSRAKLQFGQTTQSVSVGTQLGLTVTLAQAWATQHMLFFASVWPQSTWNGVGVSGVGAPLSLSQGQVAVDNGTTQNFSIYYMSVGL